MTTISSIFPSQRTSQTQNQPMISLRTKLKLKQISRILNQYHDPNNLSIGTPQLIIDNSERSQHNSSKKKNSAANVHFDNSSNSPSYRKKDNLIKQELKHKSEIVKLFGQKSSFNSLQASSGLKQTPNRSYSTTLTPGREIGNKFNGEFDLQSYRSSVGECSSQGMDQLLMVLSKKKTRIQDSKDISNQNQESAEEFNASAQKTNLNSSKTKLKRLNSTTNPHSRVGHKYPSKKLFTDLQPLDTGALTFQGKGKKLQNEPGITSDIVIKKTSNLYINDCSLEQEIHPKAPLTLPNRSDNLNGCLKVDSRISSNFLIKELGLRSQRAESLGTSSRIETLKSIYDLPKPSARKSSKKFIFKMRPNNAVKDVSNKDQDITKESNLEESNTKKKFHMTTEGKARGSMTTEADSKISNGSIGNSEDTLKKDKSNLFAQDLTHLLSRFKKVFGNYKEQRKDLKQKTLEILEKIVEFSSKTASIAPKK